MQIDRFGFLLDPTLCSALPTEQATRRELSRIAKWEHLLSQLEKLPRNRWASKTVLLHRLFKGVPDTLRKSVWVLLLPEQDQSAEADGLLSQLFSAKPSGFERQIDVDIVRTLRDHVLFRDRYSVGQQRLFRILVAFANKHPQIGYCQGMSTVAGVLLVYYAEQQAFSVFCRLFEQHNLSQLYGNGFPLLFELFWIQEQLMEKFIPSVLRHFKNYNINLTTNLYATKWYLSLFLCFPQPIAMRVWDLMFWAGTDVFPVWCITVLEAVGKVVQRLEFDPLLSFLCRPEEMFASVDALANEDALFERFDALWAKCVASKSKNMPLLHAQYRLQQQQEKK